MASLSSIIGSAIASLATSLPEAGGVVVIRGTRGTRTFEIGANAARVETIDDLISPDATATDRRRVKFYISVDEWTESTLPRPGDTITREDGTRYTVASYETKASSVLVITAKEAQ